MTLLKILALGTTSLVSVALSAAIPPAPPHDPPPPLQDAKKGGRGPDGDLKKTYDQLRRLRGDGRTTGRSEDRLKDWTDRAAKIYRDAVKASERGEERQTREFGTAAHHLARAIDHARNAASSEFDDLPPPPDGEGPQGERERTRRDLRQAHDRIVALRGGDGPDAKFYLEASKDLYNAARRDAVAGRLERAGELARAAEALTHVPDHLARATEARPEPKERRLKPEPKEKRDRPEPSKEKRDRPEPPKEKRDRPGPGEAVPPPID